MRKHAATSLVVALALIAPVLALAPELLLNPSSAQTAGDVALAFRLRQLRSPATLLMVAAGLMLTIRSWKTHSATRSRWVSVIPLLVLAASAVLARVNLVERLFAPVDEPSFGVATQVEHVAADDMVLGVQVGQQFRAYPVRMLAYHHLVNDELAGEPYVATY